MVEHINEIIQELVLDSIRIITLEKYNYISLSSSHEQALASSWLAQYRVIGDH